MPMKIKLIGAVLLLATAFAISRILNKNEDQKLLRLDGLCALLRFFRIQIDCYCAPVGEIFLRCDEGVLQSCGVFMRPRDFESFLASLPLCDQSAVQILSSFCAELGSSYREEQLKSCDYHIAKLCELRDATAIRVKNQKRLNTTLCLTATASAVILLF